MSIHTLGTSDTGDLKTILSEVLTRYDIDQIPFPRTQ